MNDKLSLHLYQNYIIMKIKNTLLTLGLGFSFLGFTQSTVEITHDDAPSILINGDTLVYASSDALVYPHITIKNVSGTDQQYKWGRKLIETPSTTFSDQICDNEGCYPCGTATDWILLGLYPDGGSFANNATTEFLPKFNFGTQGSSAHVRYYIYTANEVKIDSFDVKFTSFVGLEDDKQSIEYSAYPNPANDILNISISENNTSIALFDIVGKTVSEMELVNGNNTLNIENLNPGVYIYSIKRNGNVIETKKLVVK